MTTCLLPTGHENEVGCMYSRPSTVKRAPAGSVITRTDTNCWAASGIALEPANVRKTNNPRRFAMFTFRTRGSGELNRLRATPIFSRSSVASVRARQRATTVVRSRL